MSASLIDGREVSKLLRANIQQKVLERTRQGLRAPGLAVILLGEDPASAVYVQHKRKACAEVGIQSYAYDLPLSTTQEALLELIDTLNERKDVDGILVQLPLPPHIVTAAIIERIHHLKDVDGFNPYNLGRLAQGTPLLRPCTPYGVIQLLKHYQLPLLGKHAVVVGVSNIVGRPMALELLLAQATVTLCHRATTDLKQHITAADIVVVATGCYNVVPAEWLQEKQIIIDIGMHRHNDGSLHGDMDFTKARQKVRWITPVPGGVGPMTIATLLQNTLLAADC